MEGLESESRGRLFGMEVGGTASILKEEGSLVLRMDLCDWRMEERCSLEREEVLSKASSKGEGGCGCCLELGCLLELELVREEARVRVMVGRSVRVGYSYSKLVDGSDDEFENCLGLVQVSNFDS